MMIDVMRQMRPLSTDDERDVITGLKVQLFQAKLRALSRILIYMEEKTRDDAAKLRSS